MWGPREALNELRWRHHDLPGALIHYVHRGAPNDERVVEGARVLRLERSFMVLADRHGEAWIPYHRVRLITRNGEIVWERKAPEAREDAPRDDGTHDPSGEWAPPDSNR